MTGLSFIILFGMIHSCKQVAAVECYECADCSVPFDDDACVSRTCENTSCMKMNVTFKGQPVIVSRGCGSVGVKEEGCVKHVVSGTSSEICYCNSDTCNGASNARITFTSCFLNIAMIIMPLIGFRCT